MFTMGVSVQLDGYGLVTRCEPYITNEMMNRSRERSAGIGDVERAYSVRSWRVATRANGACAFAHVRKRLSVLAADVRNCIRQVDHALTKLAIARVDDVRLERRGNGREYGSMKPCGGV